MKIILSSLIAFFSLTAFANVNFEMLGGNYEGSGVWKDTAGQNGTYTATLSKTKVSDDTYQVACTVNVNNQTYSWTTLVQKAANDTVVIKDSENNQVGTGYCFFDQHSGTCHLEMTIQNNVIEETIHMMGNHLFRIGSNTMSGNKIMYQDHLKKHKSPQPVEN